jgi:hypothetical protein
MFGDVTGLLDVLAAGSMKGSLIILFERIVRSNIFKFWPIGNIRQANSKKDILHIVKKFGISASYNFNLSLLLVELHMQEVPSLTVSNKEFLYLFILLSMRAIFPLNLIFFN